MDKVLSVSVFGSEFDEFFELFASSFEILFVVVGMGLQVLASPESLFLFVNGRGKAEFFLLDFLQLLLQVKHITHVGLLSLFVCLEFLGETIDFLLLFGPAVGCCQGFWSLFYGAGRLADVAQPAFDHWLLLSRLLLCGFV